MVLEQRRRISSGIHNLDNFIDNEGFPEGSIILLEGGPGTGKTTFAMQSLCDSAKNGEKGLYFTGVSQSSEAIIRSMMPYKFWGTKSSKGKIIEIEKDDKKRYAIEFESGGLLSFYDDLESELDIGTIRFGFDEMESKTAGVRDVSRLPRPLNFIETEVRNINPTKIVIDPMIIEPLTKRETESPKRYLESIYKFFKFLKELNVLTFIIKGESEIGGIASYIVDGVISFGIRMGSEPEREYVRIMQIKKLRDVNHQKDILRFRFSEGQGLEVRERSSVVYSKSPL